MSWIWNFFDKTTQWGNLSHTKSYFGECIQNLASRRFRNRNSLKTFYHVIGTNNYDHSIMVTVNQMRTVLNEKKWILSQNLHEAIIFRRFPLFINNCENKRLSSFELEMFAAWRTCLSCEIENISEKFSEKRKCLYCRNNDRMNPTNYITPHLWIH